MCSFPHCFLRRTQILIKLSKIREVVHIRRPGGKKKSKFHISNSGEAKVKVKKKKKIKPITKTISFKFTVLKCQRQRGNRFKWGYGMWPKNIKVRFFLFCFVYIFDENSNKMVTICPRDCAHVKLWDLLYAGKTANFLSDTAKDARVKKKRKVESWWISTWLAIPLNNMQAYL